VTLVDSNVLIDIFSNDPVWLGWSTQQLAVRSGLGELIIDDVIYAEVATYASSASALDENLRDLDVQFRRIPRPALFAAAKAFRRYRSRGGSRPNVLPDFFIGAHAQERGCALLTRDVRRYRTYFPGLVLITPDQ
jgi:predicted nucleic acid-binding protein